MKKNFKKIFFAAICYLISFDLVSAAALDPSVADDATAGAAGAALKGGYGQVNSTTSSGLGNLIATVISAFLGLLGIIFIFLMILAGYHWMTAAGDEQKVTKAKDTIRTAIIGLVIIVAAYSITYFVLNALGNVTA